MRRKNKKVAKIPASNATTSSSVSNESDSTTQFNGVDCSENSETGQLVIDEIIDTKIENDLSQNKSDNIDNESSQSLCIKQEPTSNDTTENSYLFVQLKLISIDYKCIDYSQLIQKFLCINSNASANHIKKFITKNMKILDDSFEIVLMCNGFEVKNKCPLLFLKNRFFSNQETVILYYAIVERKLD